MKASLFASFYPLFCHFHDGLILGMTGYNSETSEISNEGGGVSSTRRPSALASSHQRTSPFLTSLEGLSQVSSENGCIFLRFVSEPFPSDLVNHMLGTFVCIKTRGQM